MLPLINDAFETLQPYVPGKPISETERELGIQNVIKLASNENPLGPSPRAREAVARALGGVADYPDGGCFYLKQRLASFLGVGAERLIVGNGTNELLEMIVRTFLRPDESVVHVVGSFIVYKLATLAAGREVVEVPLTNMKYDLERVAGALRPNTKLVFIANPNNPTGTYTTRDELDAFLARIPDDVLVVLDEAYFEYVVAPDYPNGLEYLARRERLIVTRTFSKAYGLAGLRVGYAVSHPHLIDYLNRGRQPFNVNSLAQVAAQAALDDTEHVATSCAQNREQMAVVVPRLRERGLRVVDSQANFVLVDFGRDAGAVYQALLRQGVIVRPMGGYGMPTAARITLGTAAQNERLLAALERIG